MYFEDKLLEINKKINALDSEKICIWSCGMHTKKLFEYSTVIQKNIVCLVDNNKTESTFFGFTVNTPQEVNWENIDCVIISSYRYQKEIHKQLNNMNYTGKIYELYSENDEGEFYFLPSYKSKDFYFMGKYGTWEEAEKHANGYNEQSILDNVYNATKKVISGEAAYERDSVLFYEKSYNYRILFLIALLGTRQPEVNILDFGGALGSEFWKNLDMINRVNTKISWNIVEQKNFVSLGRKKLENIQNLFFYSQIEDIDKKIDIVLFSSVLQYLPEYQNIIWRALALRAKYILVERQCISNESRICIQHVEDNIYKATYPVRIIGERELLSQFSDDYRLVTKYDSDVDVGKFFVDGMEFFYKGYLFEYDNKK